MTLPTYTPKLLLARVRSFPERTPVSDRFPIPTCYTSHRDHWIGWLGEYDGPGFYNRTSWNRDAAFVYNHLNCAPMIVWLNEAAGIEFAKAHHAYLRIMEAGGNNSRRAGAARRILPWAQACPLIFRA